MAEWAITAQLVCAGRQEHVAYITAGGDAPMAEWSITAQLVCAGRQ